ncbi:MAG: hypothetical protein R3A79_23465 [Nannocystaceae bacterium]
MILASLAALLCIAAPATAPADAPAPAEVAEAPATDGSLIVHATSDGSVTVRDANGRIAASVLVKAGQSVPVSLAPGRYTVTDDHGGPAGIEVAPGGRVEYRTTPAPAPASAPMPAVAPKPEPGPAPRVAAESGPPAPAGRRCGGGSCRRWKRVVAPLMSAGMPGAGQIVNNEPGKGIGMFLGALSLGGGAAALYVTRDPLDASTPGLAGSTFGSEAVNAAGFGMLTGGLGLLYAAQIMDAYASAAGMERPRPHTKHRIAVQLTRMATVGFRAGDPAAAFYADWNLSFLAQVRKRLSVGVSDLSVKYGIGRTTIQAGARLHYRFFDRDRLWIGAAVGTMLQGTIGRLPGTIGEAEAPGARANAFAVIPYGQLDLRLFLLDRWSLDIIPRISAPFGTRFYRRDLALPSHSATFELGTGVGVYF